MRWSFYFLAILLICNAAAGAQTKTFNFTVQNNTALNFEGGYYIIEVIQINTHGIKFVKVNLTTGGTSKTYNLYEGEDPYLSSPFDRIDLRASSITDDLASLKVELPDEWSSPKIYTIDRPTEVVSTKTPNIVLTKSVDRTEINVGDIVEFKIVVKNTGNATAYNLTLTEQLPDGFSKAKGSRFPPAINPELAPGESQELYYALKAVDAGSFNIEPAVVNYGSKSNKSNPITITVSEPVREKSNLTVSISFDKTEAETGDVIRCIVKIANTGKAQAKSVLVEGNPPSGIKIAEGDFRQVYETINPGEEKEYTVVLEPQEAGNYSIQLRTVYNDNPRGIVSRSDSIIVTKKDKNYIYYIPPIALIIIAVIVYTIKRHKEYSY